MKLTSGCREIDRVLEKVEGWGLISVFGPAGSGKTAFALQVSLKVLERGGRVLYLNTEDEMFIERLYSLASARKLKVDYSRFHVLKASNFKEQHYLITRVIPVLRNLYDLLVVDSLTGLYRLEISTSNVDRVLKRLNMQLAHLLSYSENFNSYAIVTGQVRGVEGDQEFIANAEKMLKYWSTLIFRIEKTGIGGERLFEVFKGGSFKGEFKPLKFKVVLGEVGFYDH